MKTPMKLAIICLVATLASPAAFAHGHKNKSTSMQSGQNQAFEASRLIGEQTRSNQGEDLGKLKEISFNAQNGEIFALIDRGNDKYAAVPWPLVNVAKDDNGKEKIMLNTSKAQLDAAPLVSKDEFRNLSDPSFTQRLYSYFRTQPSSAMGGTGSSGSGSIRGSSNQGDCEHDQNQK